MKSLTKLFKKQIMPRHLIVALSVASISMGALAGDILPIKRGYYVTSDTPCGNASSATLSLFWGSSMDGCKVLSNKKVNDSTYSIKSKCTERGETFTIADTYTIISSTEYKRVNAGSSQSRYCAQSQLPEPWRTNDIRSILGN
jgi:hypothetical protein